MWCYLYWLFTFPLQELQPRHRWRGGWGGLWRGGLWRGRRRWWGEWLQSHGAQLWVSASQKINSSFCACTDGDKWGYEMFRSVQVFRHSVCTYSWLESLCHQFTRFLYLKLWHRTKGESHIWTPELILENWVLSAEGWEWEECWQGIFAPVMSLFLLFVWLDLCFEAMSHFGFTSSMWQDDPLSAQAHMSLTNKVLRISAE